MPTITEATIDGFVHCRDPFCEGSEQREVQVKRTQMDYTFHELGGPGSVPGIERSSTHLACADSADEACTVCGKPAEVTDMKRPVYPAMIFDREGRSLDQKFLLRLIKEGKLGGTAPVQDDSRVAALEAELAELKALLIASSQQSQEPRRGPGRPRKNPEPDASEED